MADRCSHHHPENQHVNSPPLALAPGPTPHWVSNPTTQRQPEANTTLQPTYDQVLQRARQLLNEKRALQDEKATLQGQITDLESQNTSLNHQLDTLAARRLAEKAAYNAFASEAMSLHKVLPMVVKTTEYRAIFRALVERSRDYTAVRRAAEEAGAREASAPGQQRFEADESHSGENREMAQDIRRDSVMSGQDQNQYDYAVRERSIGGVVPDEEQTRKQADARRQLADIVSDVKQAHLCLLSQLPANVRAQAQAQPDPPPTLQQSLTTLTTNTTTFPSLIQSYLNGRHAHISPTLRPPLKRLIDPFFNETQVAAKLITKMLEEMKKECWVEPGEVEVLSTDVLVAVVGGLAALVGDLEGVEGALSGHGRYASGERAKGDGTGTGLPWKED